MPQIVLATLLVMARLTPLAIMLPRVFSGTAPRRWGMGICVVLAVAITPKYGADAAFGSVAEGPMLMALLRELILGFALALGFIVLLGGFILGGTILGQMAGVRLPQATSSHGQEIGESSVQGFFGWLTLVVLLVSGGHRQLISALIDSFRWVPLGTPPPDLQPVPLAAAMLAHCFQSGLRVAAPVAFCLLVSTLLVSVLARTMPSLGALGLNLSVNLVVLVLMTSMSLEAIATVYQQSWSQGIDLLINALMGQGGGG